MSVSKVVSVQNVDKSGVSSISKDTQGDLSARRRYKLLKNPNKFVKS